MNWTAILALLGLPALVGYLGWQLRQASADALESAKITERAVNVAEGAMTAMREFQTLNLMLSGEKAQLRCQLADAERRARRRQSRTGQRAGETDNG